MVDNLKANMLIGNDIIEPEDIVIDAKKREVHIGSCDVTAKVEIRSAKSIVRPVHLRRITIIPPRTEMPLVVHHSNVPEDRDFLFEPEDNSTFALYADMIDASTKAVIARNDTDNPVQIPRNYRLGHVVEMDFPNAFVIESTEEDVRNLAIREPKATHQDGWFKKLLSACVTAYMTAAAVSSPTRNALPNGPTTTVEPSANETILTNEVTVYNSSPANVDTFSQIVQEYPTLWKDTGFADLPKEN